MKKILKRMLAVIVLTIVICLGLALYPLFAVLYIASGYDISEKIEDYFRA